MKKKILIISANPTNTPRLRLDEEIREIQSCCSNKFIVEIKLAVRVIDFQRALLTFKPNIVHFCGFSDGNNNVFFEDAVDGEKQLVPLKTLSYLLGLFKEDIETVFFNTFLSEKEVEIISKNIPNVVFLKENKSDKEAIIFAKEFYKTLCKS